jgi:hypothetical protein
MGDMGMAWAIITIIMQVMIMILETQGEMQGVEENSIIQAILNK